MTSHISHLHLLDLFLINVRNNDVLHLVDDAGEDIARRELKIVLHTHCEN